MPDTTVAIWILCLSFTLFLVLRFPVALVLALSSLVTLWYLDMPVVLVAHSGAGPLLPAIRASIHNPIRAYVFVDAGLPRDGRGKIGSRRAWAPISRAVW